jgi:hypothetical protein
VRQGALPRGPLAGMRHPFTIGLLLLPAVLPAQHDMVGVTFTGQSVAFAGRTRSWSRSVSDR